jgi:leucine-rich repeat protein SHOC2
MHTFPVKMKNWNKIQTLVVDRRDTDTILSEMWTLTKMRRLSLRYSKVSFIPSEISHLTNLTSINVNSNQITHVSNQITKLFQLQSLNLSDNQITEFLDDISSFLHLTMLWLNRNKMSKCPSLFPRNLVILDLSWNAITSLPSTVIFSLTRLEGLFLSNNQITEIPTEIGLLTALHSLYLDNNKLSFVPSELMGLSKLNVLIVTFNKLTCVPLIESQSLQLFEISKSQPLKIVNGLHNCSWHEFVRVQNDLYATQ